MDNALFCPFWIDTAGYTDRDREMFVCGYEFCAILGHITTHAEGLTVLIHRENESRLRMLCGRFKRTCNIEQCSEEHDPDGTWSVLKIGKKR